jgi:photosystem II stability/assembly factor-like uncharacterized protein
MTQKASGNSTINWGFFNAVDTIDGSIAVGVGDGGTLGRTINAGGTWSSSGNIGGIGSEVADVEMVPTDATIAWLVGYGGRVQRVSNLAGAWSTTSRVGDLAAKGWPAPIDVVSIAVLDDLTVWIGGFGGRIAKTVDGGTTWTVYTLAGTGSVTALEIAPTGHVWATTTGNGVGNIWRTTTATGAAATDWTQYPAAPGGAGLNDIVVPDATHGYAVGDDGDLYSWSGAAWTYRGDADLESGSLYGVASLPSAPAVAVAVGEAGTILRTSTSGTSWGRVTSPTGDSLLAVRAGTGGMVASGFARVGVGGNTAGTTWTWNGDTVAGRTRWGSAIDPVDGRIGLQVGSRGTIWRTTDGGATWGTVASGTTEPLFDVTYEKADVAWAVGGNGTILRSGDGGLTWSPRTSNTNVRLREVSSGDTGFIVAIGDAGTVVRSNNGGSTFVATNPTTNYIFDISMASRMVGVMTGHTFIRRTTDGGATWTLATSVPSVTDVLSAYMVDDNVGYAGTSWSGLWKTVDGGANWSTVASHVSNGGISEVDGTGTHVYTSINKTLYRSTDGGATWTIHDTYSTWPLDMDVGDDFTILSGGIAGSTWYKLGSNVVGAKVPDYGAAPNSWAPSAESMFGVCLQNVGGTASAAAPFTDDANTCTTSDLDVWQPVTASPVKMASATANTGSVDVVFGVRFSPSQAVGTYSAGVLFEALAPNV